MRSGRLKSSMAAPSRRNSGFDATEISISGLESRMMRSTSSPVPTGTVDLVTTTVGPSSAAAISRASPIDVSEISVAVPAARRRSYGDHDHLGRGDCAGKVRGEGEAACSDVGGDEVGEAGLVDRHFAPLKHGDLGRIVVDRHDGMSKVGEAGA